MAAWSFRRKAAKEWWSKDLSAAGELKRKNHRLWAKPGSSLEAKAAMQSSQRAYKALVRREKRKLVQTQIDRAGERSKQQRTKAVFDWYKHAEGKAEDTSSAPRPSWGREPS